MPDRIGSWLFRLRGWIGVAGYAVVLCVSSTSTRSILLSLPLTAAGLFLRFWGSGYIGSLARVNSITAGQRIISGPYGSLRHPLYIGNGLLVVGVLVALSPPRWLSVIAAMLFVLEYTTIVRAEEKNLAGCAPVEVGFSLRRAACEWQTLLAVAAAYALGVLKVAL